MMKLSNEGKAIAKFAWLKTEKNTAVKQWPHGSIKSFRGILD